jgi:hypothetical protein
MAAVYARKRTILRREWSALKTVSAPGRIRGRFLLAPRQEPSIDSTLHEREHQPLRLRGSGNRDAVAPRERHRGRGRVSPGRALNLNGSGFARNATVFPGQPYNAILRVSGFNLPVELMNFVVQ